MLRSLFDTEWMRSPAHLLLLSKFMSPRAISDFSRGDAWQDVLKEPSEKAIKRLMDEKMIATVTTDELLDIKYKVTELKQMLKSKQLPVSGTKGELIQRLLNADPKGAQQAVAGLTIYKCTIEGKVIAVQYLAHEKEKRALTEQYVLDALKKAKYKDAATIVAQYEGEQVFPRGMGIDWKRYDTKHDEIFLSKLFTCKPHVLSALSSEQLNVVRLIGGLRYLLGYTNMDWSLPDDFINPTAYDKSAIPHLLMSNAYFHTNIAEAQELQKTIGNIIVEVNTVNDEMVCDECKTLAKHTYTINQIQELPYKKCTCKFGCRCSISAHPKY
ncbi:MAG: hypothetical protein M1434_11505 [Chloroflexi bacterium]|nr:hypothetical protein [Chloroflexota bacterium]MCL5275349.1 hypothetical protein [Chloroflexota bacterium]